MGKGRDGEKWKKKKITAKIVATTSLPVDRLTATDCNADARANIIVAWHLLQLPEQKEKMKGIAMSKLLILVVTNILEIEASCQHQY